MRRSIPVLLLVLGLAVMVRPVGRRVKRAWYAWSAARIWDECRERPSTRVFGEPYAWLKISPVGVDLLVLDGADERNLSRCPCHETVGVASLVMAHRDTHFRCLEKIEEGDVIRMELRGGGTRTYRCRSILIVDKADVERLIQRHSTTDCLLLVTCYPFRYVGPAPQRFLIVAEPVE